MKINTPSPALTRAIARRLANRVAQLRRNKAKPIHKTHKEPHGEQVDASQSNEAALEEEEPSIIP
jgi:hypothetical protein